MLLFRNNYRRDCMQYFKNNTFLFIFLYIVTFLLFNVTRVQSQPHFFRHYQVENGLSNNTVFSSMQDKDGFLWFGTKDGLNRFDGYHFKHFTINDEGHSLTPDIISCMLTDNKGTLFIGCQKGLYYFDKQKECLVRLIDSLIVINALHIDNEGQLWFISGGTLCRYNLNTKKLYQFSPQKYFNAISVCAADNGDVWAATDDGFLQKFNPEKNSFTAYNVFSHSPPVVTRWIQKIHSNGHNGIFVGTSSQGIKEFDIASASYKDILTFNPDKTTIYVRDIERYSQNEYWFATESGIFIFNSLTGKFINLKKKFLDPYSLSDNAVYDIFKDREGGMWAGTYFGGINYYSKQYASFQKYFPDNSGNSISGSAVREICADHNGNLWIGTEDAGLNKLNPLTGAITQYKPSGESSSIAYFNIHGLLVSGNNLWIGTFEHGLDVMDIPSGKVKIHYSAGPGKKEIKNNFVISLLQTTSGEIYAGTGTALYKFDKKSHGFDPAADIPQHIFVSSLLEDREKNVWVGTHGSGVFYFNPATKKTKHFDKNISDQNSLTNNIINAIYEDSQQNIWISTDGGGLCKLNKDRKIFTSYTTKNGFPSNFIFKVLEDNGGQIWVTTSRGLVNLNPQNNRVIVYTKNNGLLNDQFNYNSGYKDTSGALYFGSTKGMIRFNPGDFLQTIIAPPVFITSFQVENKELTVDEDSSLLKQSIIYTNNITLPYNRSSFNINFAALSFISPEMTEYKYFMEGIDKDWTIVKPNRTIYFTNLAPGKYVFTLNAGINGVWGNTVKQLTIHVTPPFWATWWAWILYIFFAVALCYYLLRTYHIIIEDKKEKEIYEAKIDFFTNVAHEIRTPLTLIKGPVENLREKMDELPSIKEDVIVMERNTNRLIALVTQILDFRKTETKNFSIDFVKVNISELLREAALNFSTLAKKRKLEYSINIPPAEVYVYADEEALTKIFSNLFNNAVIYAGKKVQVSLLPPQNNEQELTIEFANDGNAIPQEMKEKIFEPFYRLKGTNKQQGTGIGLALAKSLTELHKGKLYLKYSTEGMNIFVFCLPAKNMESLQKKTTQLNDY